MNKCFKYKFQHVIYLILLPFTTFAQTQNGESNDFIELSFFIFFTLIILTLIIFVQYHNAVVKVKRKDEVSLFAKISKLLTKSTPIEKEEDILLDHNYDGIKELDNSLPPWWKWLFYVTIAFSVVYMLNYHVFNYGLLSTDELKEEIRLAELEKAQILGSGSIVDENKLTVLNDASALFSGKEIFTKNCAACHGQKGEGLVGPNLTDDYWIHGGGIKNIYQVIKNGVPEKGMISWKSQLNSQSILEVGSFIISLRGTNPPNAKAPQGDLWKEELDLTNKN